MAPLFRSVNQPVAIISFILSCSVVITVLLFPDMIRAKIFTQIVALVSLCDALGNWPYMLSSNPANGTVLCSIESFFNLYFFPVGWMLTAFLTKLFRDLVLYRKLNLSLRLVLIGSFGFPLATTLSLLSTNTYGITDDKQQQACFYGGNKHTGYIWHVATYAVLLFVCLGLMCYFLGEVFWSEWMGHCQINPKMYSLLKRILVLYPVAMFVCWMPHGVCMLVPQCFYNVSIETVVDAFKIFHGGFVAMIFYCMSGEARKRWYDLLTGKTKLFQLGGGGNTNATDNMADAIVTADALMSSMDNNSNDITVGPTTTNILPDDACVIAILMRCAAMEDARASKLSMGVRGSTFA